MTRDELVGEIIRLLRNHKDGLAGSIHQDPYKSDFFKLFAAAYNAGMMHRADYPAHMDALVSPLVAREPELIEGKTWQTLCDFWGEWTYAWDHVHQLNR
jgi:hypothetical protein